MTQKSAEKRGLAEARKARPSRSKAAITVRAAAQLVDDRPDAEEIAMSKIKPAAPTIPQPHLTIADFEPSPVDLSIAVLQGEKSKLEDKVIDLESANLRLHEDLATARGERDKAEERAFDAEKREAEMSDALDTAQIERGHAQAEQAKAEERIDELQRLLATRNSEVQRLVGEQEDMHGKLKVAEANLSNASKAIKARDAEIDSRNDELFALRTRGLLARILNRGSRSSSMKEGI